MGEQWAIVLLALVVIGVIILTVGLVGFIVWTALALMLAPLVGKFIRGR